MADIVKFPDLEKREAERWKQVAYKAGRKHKGEPSRRVLVDQYSAPQEYVNEHWKWLSRAWIAGANPKPMPRPKPKVKGLGFANKEK